MSGPAAYGFRWEDGRLVPDPAEAPVRRRMYDLFLEHRRLKTVARLMSRAGQSRRGSFSDTTIRRLLRDPAAVGAIVPEEIWKRCQALLDERERGVQQRPTRRPVHLFGGRVSCDCGRSMRVRTAPSGAKLVCPGCPEQKIEAEVLEQLLARELETLEIAPAGLLAVFQDESKAYAMLAQILGQDAVRVSTVWSLLTESERLEFVDHLVARIVVSRDEVTIELALFPPFHADFPDVLSQPVAQSPLSGQPQQTASGSGNELRSDEPAGQKIPAAEAGGSPPARLPELVTVEELSRRWHLKPDTIRALARRRRIPSRKLGRLTVFESRELERWLGKLPRAGTEGSSSEA